MAERPTSGVLDTCTYIDLSALDPESLPAFPEITSVTMAELHQGVAMGKDAVSRAARAEQLATAIADFEPIPFDREAAARYGTFTTLVLATGRGIRHRKLDLMIAATASVHRLPLYTRNADDFRGLEGALTVVAV